MVTETSGRMYLREVINDAMHGYIRSRKADYHFGMKKCLRMVSNNLTDLGYTDSEVRLLMNRFDKHITRKMKEGK